MCLNLQALLVPHAIGVSDDAGKRDEPGCRREPVRERRSQTGAEYQCADPRRQLGELQSGQAAPSDVAAAA
jgi:hypothetical protein